MAGEGAHAVTSREMVELIEGMKRNTQAVEGLSEILRGNGKPGLILQVDRIQQFLTPLGLGTEGSSVTRRLDALEGFKRTVEGIALRVLLPILIAETLSLIGLGIGVLTHTIRIVY